MSSKTRAKKAREDMKKFEKTLRIFILTVVTVVLLYLAGLDLPYILRLYDSLTGVQGLKNAVLALSIKLICGILGSAVIITAGISQIKYLIRIKEKGFFIAAAAVLTVFFAVVNCFVFPRSHFREQHEIIGTSGLFADERLLFKCIADLNADEYTEFTINGCMAEPLFYGSGSRWADRHSEELVYLKYGKDTVCMAQIGTREASYFRDELPYLFETAVTVYKNSGFVRSAEPSVEYSHVESYEHFYTISISGEDIVFEKNIDEDLRPSWCGFASGKHEDIKNALFMIGVTDEHPELEASFLGKICDEVCLYAVTDGKYRRVSGVLTVNP